MAVVREDVVKMGFDIDLSELTRLTSALDDIKRILTGGIGDDAFDEMQKDAKNASAGIDGIKDSIKGIKPDGIDDTVRGLKNTDEKAEEANKEMRKLGNTSFDKTISGLDSMTGKLGAIAVNVGKVIATGIAAGAAGVGAIVAESVKNYANYEQLVGGVDTLFKTMSGTVQKNAENAWKTAGLSANAYMETVTSFSASLIQSLGGDTAKAAAYADMAIIDMADNANKMGTDISSLQDAYQGFAKQNYTMLDNLKLGYGGTQEEMKRLLKDATALSGVEYDISSYADIVAAIHVIQEEMGVAGTTAAEASDTISGSFNAMKAAWSNTLTSLVLGGEDYERCIDNLVESAKTFGKNIMPAITKALRGVGSLIEDLAPMLEKELPEIIDLLLPPLIKAATSLLKGLIVALPSVIRTLVDELPNILTQVWQAFSEAFGEIPGLEKATNFFNGIVKFIQDNSDTIEKFVPVILGILVAIKLLSKAQGLLSLFGGGAGGGGAAGGGGGMLGYKNVASAMGGIAIAIGGFAAIVAAFGLLKQIPGYDEFMASGGDALSQLCDIIADVGLVGAAFVGFVAVVGKNVTIKDAATGMADIAIALLGMEAIVLAFSKIASMDGYTEFIAGGGAAMQQLCDIITAIAPVGAAFLGFVAIVGKTVTIRDAATGMADIAIALLGMEAIVGAFATLASIDGYAEFMSGGSDAMTQLCGIITSIAPVGIALLVFATVVGKTASIKDVATGMADIAVALLGMEAIVAAFATLASIDGYTEFMAGGGAAMQQLCGIITDVAAVGAAFVGFVAIVGAFTSISTVAEGLGIIATALLGMEAIVAAFAALTLIDGYTEFITKGGEALGQLCDIISDIGLVGAAFVTFVSVVGTFANIGTAASGLGVIATALGGFALVVEAFGLLTAIPGFDEFLTKGGQVLTDLCGILGSMVGEAIGKLGEGITASLPTIGENLAAFATAIQPMIETFSGFDSAGLTDFAGAFAAFIGVIVGEKIVSAITGGVDYAGLGTKLNTMAQGLGGFFSTVSAIPDGSFEKATALFECLAGIESMPKEGGVVGWFEGEVDYRKMADGLSNLGGAFGFFTDVNKIPEEAFTKAKQLFECLAGVKALPQDGGVVGWFMGEIDYRKIADGIQQLGSAEMIAAITAISAIPAEGFTALTTMFETLAGVKALPKEGGVVDWFTGDNTTGLTNVSNNLPGVATSIATFFANLGGITDFTPITALFDALAGIQTMPKEGGIADWFTGDNTTALTNISGKLPGVATNIAAFFANLKGRTDFTPIKSLFDTLSDIKIDSDAADDGFLGLGESKMEEMGKGLATFASSASTFFNTINTLNVENLKTFFNFIETAGELPTALSSLDSTLAGTLSVICTTVDAKMAAIEKSIADHMGAALTTLQSLKTGFKTSGVAAIQGLITGMNSMLPSLISTARSMAAAVQSAFDVELDINSPSKVMEKKGEFTGMGSIIGLRNMIPEARSAAQDFAMAATPYGNYTPESSVDTYNTSSSEVTNVSPVFNLNISGSQDDRTLARKVKRYVAQAVSDTLESFERKTYVVREV